MSETTLYGADAITAQLRNEIEAAFSGLEPWFVKEGPVRIYRSSREIWCIDQILEHISLANHYLLLLIDKGARKALKRADAAQIKQVLQQYALANPALEEIGVNNSFEWRCPVHMVPTGEHPLEQTRDLLLNQRSRLMDYLAMLKNGEGALFKMHMSVHSLGRLDVYQYMYFLLKHVRRHIQQMEEIEREFKGG